MKIHISGPITGYKNRNRAAFKAVQRELEIRGHMAFNPQDLDAALSYRELMRHNLEWICTEADGIVVLHGWKQSKGSRAEAALAHALGIPIFQWPILPNERNEPEWCAVDYNGRPIPLSVDMQA